MRKKEKNARIGLYKRRGSESFPWDVFLRSSSDNMDVEIFKLSKQSNKRQLTQYLNSKTDDEVSILSIDFITSESHLT